MPKRPEKPPPRKVGGLYAGPGARLTVWLAMMLISGILLAILVAGPLGFGVYLSILVLAGIGWALFIWALGHKKNNRVQHLADRRENVKAQEKLKQHKR